MFHWLRLDEQFTTILFLFPSSRHLRRINTERLILDRESFTSWLGSKVVSKDNLRTNIAKFLGRSVLVDGEGHVSKTSMKSKGGRKDRFARGGYQNPWTGFGTSIVNRSPFDN